LNEQATFATRVLDGAEVLTISGEIDVSNKEQFELALHAGLAQNLNTFIANLLNVTYADSACIHALHQAQRSADTMNKSFVVVIKEGGGLQKILRIAGDASGS
jgi:anti-anti-sigma factor